MIYVIYILSVIFTYIITKLLMKKWSPEVGWTIHDRNVLLFFCFTMPILTFLLSVLMILLFYCQDKFKFKPNNNSSKW